MVQMDDGEYLYLLWPIIYARDRGQKGRVSPVRLFLWEPNACLHIYAGSMKTMKIPNNFGDEHNMSSNSAPSIYQHWEQNLSFLRKEYRTIILSKTETCLQRNSAYNVLLHYKLYFFKT